jgi:hypothetical protein
MTLPRFPFVRRSTHEAELSQLRQQIAVADTRLHETDAQYESLISQLRQQYSEQASDLRRQIAVADTRLVETRERYESLISELRQQIADLKQQHVEQTSELRRQVSDRDEERRMVLDHMQMLNYGRPIFAAVEEKPKTAEQQATSDADDDSLLIAEAKRRGYRSARAIAEYITREKERRSEQRHRTTALTASAVSHISVAEDFAAAIEEGQQAAQQTTAPAA